MGNILVTGGTVFVSRYVAEYFVARGAEVYVLNRNTKPQSAGVHLIEGDRHALDQAAKDRMRGVFFDAVIDVTAYDAQDVTCLTDALGEFGSFVMISSSAVYPETERQPFTEESALGVNKFWGNYGTDKIAAEAALRERVQDAYILRPPYLYGPMNNVYREAFVFACAMQDRLFYLPRNGEMKLQFFHVRDLCRVIERILEIKPKQHILNVGNRETVTVKEWVELGYRVVGKTPQFVPVLDGTEQRKYFSFYDYEYYLDVEKMYGILGDVIPLAEGLREAYEWYREKPELVAEKPYMTYIDDKFSSQKK